MNAVSELDAHLQIHSETPETILATCCLPASYAGFQGHFPGAPTLPGVCQILLVQKSVERHLARKLELKKLKRNKFLQPVLPETELTARIAIQPGEERSWSIHAELHAGTNRVAAIRMELAEPKDPS